MTDLLNGAPTLGIDIGGTKIGISLVDATGRELAATRIATDPAHGAESALEATVAAARVAFGATLGGALAVGVCVAGQVGPRGVLVGAPNLGWAGAQLGDIASRLFGRPVVVLNDVHAAAWAEWRGGAGRGAQDVVVLFIGTGVGGAVIADGKLLLGASGALGEIGHMTIVAGGRQCHCRNTGCLEAYVSGWAIAERATEAAERDPAGAAALVAIAGGRGAEITSEAVAAAHRAGDPFTSRFVDETAAYLGAAAVGLVNGWNPAALILGGGVIDGFPGMLEVTARAVQRHALPASASAVTIARAAMGNHAPAIGAALVARTA
jgi:glucokinase